MAESVYKVIELVGTSPDSWEKAAAAAVKRAAQTLRDLRVAEVSQLDMQLKDGKIESYRAKVMGLLDNIRPAVETEATLMLANWTNELLAA